MRSLAIPMMLVGILIVIALIFFVVSRASPTQYRDPREPDTRSLAEAAEDPFG